MREAIKHLIQLQELDKKLDELERAKGGLPQKVRELEDKLQTTRNDLQSKQDEFETVQKDKRQVERDIEKLQQSKKKYEEQLYSVTTNKEYDAVTLEIETAVERIDEKETELLQLIEREEVLQKEIDELKEMVKKLEAEFEQQNAVLQEKIAANAKVETDLQAQRKQVVGQIRIQHLRLYEKIRTHKDGLAVVPIIRGACGGCYTNIPPQRSMEVRDGDKLIVCESCGRILFWQEEEASVSVES
ncbi:MAG: C4-type zinc ribbon domain-containing protein [candidate division KSB1 bacterium]|nr:C4-type zinc ribbon domain-containing protein [candidate division KSB1 bacterium]MDQ7065573.1 C4-type zinc ribbon domain-containing protein [candidate division KSB1 bacterium]